MSEESEAIYFKLDNIAPNAPIISELGGSFSSVSIILYGENHATIEYSLDGGTSWQVYNGAIKLTELGTYNLVTRQIDEAGNVSVKSGVRTFIIEINPPRIIGSKMIFPVYNT